MQVKGGKVTPDSVGRLYSTVIQCGATAGIFVCFDKYMNTVNNNRIKNYYSDLSGKYPVIQGFSIEQLLKKEKPILPSFVMREGAKLQGQMFGDQYQQTAKALPEDLKNLIIIPCRYKFKQARKHI